MPPVSPDLLANALLPIGYIAGTLRTTLILALGLVYVILVSGVCTLLVSVHVSPPQEALINAHQVTHTPFISNSDTPAYRYHCKDCASTGGDMVDTRRLSASQTQRVRARILDS